MKKKIDSKSDIIKPSNNKMEVESKLGFKFKTQIRVREMIGTILQKKEIENYQGKYAGKFYYNLTVKIQTPEYSHINRLLCSPEKAVNQRLIEDIRDNKWVDRKYVFKTTYTSKFFSGYNWLIDWQEVIPPKKK